MGAAADSEIFDRLIHNFRLAAEHCEDLAKLPRKGPTYKKLRDELKLIEGHCRFIAQQREDARWLQIGLQMAEAHQRAGGWLRGIKMPNGQRRAIRPGELHPLFMMLAENLRLGLRIANEFRTKATGRVGMILPKPQPFHRESRPMQVMLPPGIARVTPGGVLIPHEATKAGARNKGFETYRTELRDLSAPASAA